MPTAIPSPVRACWICSPAPARLGFEALSRGADFVLFVDDGAEARAILRENIAALGLGGMTRIFRRDATKLGAAHPIEPFSLVFVDPPYGRGPRRAGTCLGPRWRLARARRASIVVEEAAQSRFVAPPGFVELERRPYDTTELIFLQVGAGVGEGRRVN